VKLACANRRSPSVAVTVTSVLRESLQSTDHASVNPVKMGDPPPAYHVPVEDAMATWGCVTAYFRPAATASTFTVSAPYTAVGGAMDEAVACVVVELAAITTAPVEDATQLPAEFQ
jgi:hypothetical protein